jgi:hypothetical protein
MEEDSSLSDDESVEFLRRIPSSQDEEEDKKQFHNIKLILLQPVSYRF